MTAKVIYTNGSRELTVEKFGPEHDYGLAFKRQLQGEDAVEIDLDRWDFEILAEKLGFHTGDSYDQVESDKLQYSAEVEAVRKELDAARKTLLRIAESLSWLDRGDVEKSLLHSHGYEDPETQAYAVNDALQALEMALYDAHHQIA